MRKFLPLLALAALLAGMVPSSSAAQVAPPAPPPMSTPLVPTASPEYGAAVFLMGRPETTERDVQAAVGAGFQWIRLLVQWRSVEPSCQNCIDWTALDAAVGAASAAGLKILARIDHQPAWSRALPAENGPPDDIFNYADFASVVAKRYRMGSPKGTIQAIEVWNEPNLSREWGGRAIDREQASQYMYMLKETYKLVKAEDPTKVIVSAGLSPTGTTDGTAMDDVTYLDWLYDSDLALYSDAIGMTTKGYGNPPEAELLSNPNFSHPSFYFRRVEQLRNVMQQHGDGGKQIWLLEVGWTTDQQNPNYSWYAVTPEQQAEYIVRSYQYAKQAWSPWVGPMFAWTFADPTWGPEREEFHWRITNGDGTPHPAYEAFKAARATGALP